MTQRFELVPFDDRHIMTVQDSDGLFVVMKPISEGLGLTWHGQFERIRRHPVISKGVRVTRIPSAGGMQEVVALHLEQFHGWLLTLSPDRIADEDKRATIIRYQERAFRVIFEHFHGKMGAASPDLPDRTARRRELPGLMDRLRLEKNPEIRRVLHSLVVRGCEAEGIEPPAIDAIGRAGPTQNDRVAVFFAAIGAVEAAGEVCNHSRSSDRRAYNLRQLKELFARHRQPIQIDMALRKALRASTNPPFITDGGVNSAITGRTVSCWIFER